MRKLRNIRSIFEKFGDATLIGRAKLQKGGQNALLGRFEQASWDELIFKCEYASKMRYRDTCPHSDYFGKIFLPLGPQLRCL